MYATRSTPGVHYKEYTWCTLRGVHQVYATRSTPGVRYGGVHQVYAMRSTPGVCYEEYTRCTLRGVHQPWLPALQSSSCNILQYPLFPASLKTVNYSTGLLWYWPDGWVSHDHHTMMHSNDSHVSVTCSSFSSMSFLNCSLLSFSSLKEDSLVVLRVLYCSVCS